MARLHSEQTRRSFGQQLSHAHVFMQSGERTCLCRGKASLQLQFSIIKNIFWNFFNISDVHMNSFQTTNSFLQTEKNCHNNFQASDDFEDYFSISIVSLTRNLTKNNIKCKEKVGTIRIFYKIQHLCAIAGYC